MMSTSKMLLTKLFLVATIMTSGFATSLSAGVITTEGEFKNVNYDSFFGPLNIQQELVLDTLSAFGGSGSGIRFNTQFHYLKFEQETRYGALKWKANEINMRSASLFEDDTGYEATLSRYQSMTRDFKASPSTPDLNAYLFNNKIYLPRRDLYLFEDAQLEGSVGREPFDTLFADEAPDEQHFRAGKYRDDFETDWDGLLDFVPDYAVPDSSHFLNFSFSSLLLSEGISNLNLDYFYAALRGTMTTMVRDDNIFPFSIYAHNALFEVDDGLNIKTSLTFWYEDLVTAQKGQNRLARYQNSNSFLGQLISNGILFDDFNYQDNYGCTVGSPDCYRSSIMPIADYPEFSGAVTPSASPSVNVPEPKVFSLLMFGLVFLALRQIRGEQAQWRKIAP